MTTTIQTEVIGQLHPRHQEPLARSPSPSASIQNLFFKFYYFDLISSCPHQYLKWWLTTCRQEYRYSYIKVCEHKLYVVNMAMEIVLVGVCALALVFPTLAQDRNCNLGDLFTPNTLETLIQLSIKMGDNPSTPGITVYTTRIVCLSVGPSIGYVSSISLLVNYT